MVMRRKIEREGRKGGMIMIGTTNVVFIRTVQRNQPWGEWRRVLIENNSE